MTADTPTTAIAPEEPSNLGTPLVFKARFHRKWKGCRIVMTQNAPLPPTSRPARIAIMLALAHKIEQAITEGNIHDRAHAAKLLGVTRARMTQNLDLLLLAPDIQEEILAMETLDGRQLLNQSRIRPVVAKRTWLEQRRLWQSIRRDRR